MDKISKYISFEESIRSQTATRMGIINIPGAKEIENMKLVAKTCFDPVREHFGVPIGVSSFYRCDALNKAIGGSLTSQHRSGQAIDIDADMYGKISNKEIFDYIRKMLDFDQVISEFPDENGNPSWVHVSYVSPEKNRRQILTAYSKNGRTHYKKFI